MADRESPSDMAPGLRSCHHHGWADGKPDLSRKYVLMSVWDGPLQWEDAPCPLVASSAAAAKPDFAHLRAPDLTVGCPEPANGAVRSVGFALFRIMIPRLRVKCGE